MNATAPDLRVLHAVRTLGFAGTSQIAERVQLSVAEAEEHLLDAQAYGRVSWSEFGGGGGWSLTEAGKSHGEKLLAVELKVTGARPLLEEVHRDFLPLNETVATACSRWQLAELGMGEDPPTLAETIAVLSFPSDRLLDLENRLTTKLQRFTGYHVRFASALTRAAEDPAWITGTDRDSCHKVWFELHEDLIASLGLTR